MRLTASLLTRLLATAPALAAAPAIVAAPEPAPAVAAASAPAPGIGAARLEGQFQLEGRVTAAKLVPGERVGQVVSRTWTFNPACAAGACDQVQLVRARASGTDSVTLHRRKPGYYVGAGSFFAPLQCGSQLYPRGSAVPFTITVTVMAALPTPGVAVASRVTATYLNRSRRNLTPCVGVLGHDAATYHGHLQLGPSPSGGGGA